MSFKVYYWNCASGFLKKFDYVKELIETNDVDVFFIAESETRYEFDLSFLSIDGYEVVCAKTLLSRKKSRIICFKKSEIKVVNTSHDLNDTLILDTEVGIIVGAYRGFKCFPGETEISNWNRLISEFNELDFNKKIMIVGDLNIDPTRPTYLKNELFSWCDGKGLVVSDLGVTRTRLVGDVLQESNLDIILSNIQEIKVQKEANEMSDHVVLKLSMNRFETINREKTIVEYLNWKFDEEAARAFLKNELEALSLMSEPNPIELDYQIRACLITTFKDSSKNGNFCLGIQLKLFPRKSSD